MKAGSRKQKQRHQLTLFPQETKVTKVFFLSLCHLPKAELEAKIPVFGFPMPVISPSISLGPSRKTNYSFKM